MPFSEGCLTPRLLLDCTLGSLPEEKRQEGITETDLVKFEEILQELLDPKRKEIAYVDYPNIINFLDGEVHKRFYWYKNGRYYCEELTKEQEQQIKENVEMAKQWFPENIVQEAMQQFYTEL